MTKATVTIHDVQAVLIPHTKKNAMGCRLVELEIKGVSYGSRFMNVTTQEEMEKAAPDLFRKLSA